MKWDNAKKTLTIAFPLGKYRAADKERTFNIKVITAESSSVQKAEKTIIYKNQKTEINF